ncbi:DUF4221 family protein [Parapedobacter koreensis]|uniref:DUF4221 family protein n=1 Tax=Parapedobacter koreensis TaxID=332977 RepID=UPI00373FDD45
MAPFYWRSQRQHICCRPHDFIFLILYDKYRKVYYRISTVPLLNWEPTDSKFEKPLSIITIDEPGKILSESPVFQNPQDTNAIFAYP